MTLNEIKTAMDNAIEEEAECVFQEILAECDNCMDLAFYSCRRNFIDERVNRGFKNAWYFTESDNPLKGGQYSRAMHIVTEKIVMKIEEYLGSVSIKPSAGAQVPLSETAAYYAGKMLDSEYHGEKVIEVKALLEDHAGACKVLHVWAPPKDPYKGVYCTAVSLGGWHDDEN